MKVRFKYDARTGAKLLAYAPSLVQELSVVTNASLRLFFL